MIHSIPTTYKGIRFRSKLEARWAYIFDCLEWGWEYEPFEMGGYIPDFVLLFKQRIFVDVKPGLSTNELELLGEKAASACGDGTLILGAANCIMKESERSLSPVGVQLWRMAPFSAPEWDIATIFKCGICNKPSLNNYYGSFACQLNGCYDGDGHVTELEEWGAIWAGSKNKFQWKKEGLS